MGCKTVKYILKGLDCANCAAKIEKELSNIEGIGHVSVNFATQSLVLDPEFEMIAQDIVKKVEPSVKLVPANSQTSGEGTTLADQSKVKGRLSRIIIAALLLAGGSVFREALQSTPAGVMEYVVFLGAYILVGREVVWAAIRNIGRGKVFDENFLMTLATIAAIAIRQMPEAVGVMLFFRVGEFFQELAVNRARRSISALMDIRPDYANLIEDGVSTKVSPEAVTSGQLIEVKPGEKVPLDGEVVQGTSFVDTSVLTGESVPRKVGVGDPVLAGVINGSGLLKVRVSREFSASSAAKILELVENAASRKAPTEKFITRFAGWYTPLVVASALAVAVIPPLVLPEATFAQWIYRALILLVISCPCALVVSVPLGYFGGIGGASRAGVLVKGANFLDALTQAHTVVFDKTGTLTKGIFKVSHVSAKNGFTRDQLLYWAALAEVHSNHPIAKSVLEAYHGNLDPEVVEDYQEIEGHGVKVTAGGKTILAGNDRLMRRENIEIDVVQVTGTVVYVAVDGIFAGYLNITDVVKEGLPEAIAQLKKLGVKRTVMLTGDRENIAAKVAETVGLDSYFAQLLPQEKVAKVEELKNSLSGKDDKLVFVGDGINDAPVIMRSDVGVAMGAIGSDAAIEAADVVLMDDDPRKLVKVIQLARHTKKIVKQNIILALLVKGVFVVLGAMGTATMWEAVFADVGVAVLAVLNATRTLRAR